MSDLIVRPASSLEGTLTIPGDKSVSHRAFLLGGLCHGSFRASGILNSDDVQRSRRAMEALGVSVRDAGEGAVEIQRTGREGFRKPSGPLEMGNSGTTTRLLMGILAGCAFPVTLQGDESLSRRPMRRVTEPLTRMGAAFEGGDHLPLTVRGGKLKGIRYEMPVASAQVKSALLLAGLGADGPTTVVEPLPTRDHTERMLRWMGAKIEIASAPSAKQSDITIYPGPLTARDLRVPGDFSSAAFFLAAASIVPGSRVTVEGVGLNPTRTALLDLLRRMGADLKIQPSSESGPEPIGDITVSARPLKGIEVDPAVVPNAIDELPVLMVAATQAEGVTRLEGVAELRVKETDRIRSMVAGLSSMGACIREEGDAVFVEGPCRLRGARVESFGDHRTAMALAVAGLVAEGPTQVQGSEWINISFPEFPSLLETLRRG